MASKENPVDINNSNITDLRKIPNIGDKRALAIVKLREEKGSLTLEDVKTQLSSIPSTLWDPLVREGVIVFTERVEREETEQPVVDQKDTENEIGKLYSQISRQEKEIERKNIQIEQSEREITACQ